MSEFGPTRERLERIADRMPGYPQEAMRLVRLTYHLQKSLRDRANAVLKQFDLVDTSHTVLAILYGSPDETSAASRLSQACYEKPANLTRICDELVARGLIVRNPAPGDRRGVMITLTAQGRALAEQVLPAVSAALTGAYAGLSAAELQQLEGLSARVLQAFDSGD